MEIFKSRRKEKNPNLSMTALQSINKAVVQRYFDPALWPKANGIETNSEWNTRRNRLAELKLEISKNIVLKYFV